jgi:hypothetical protein
MSAMRRRSAGLMERGEGRGGRGRRRRSTRVARPEGRFLLAWRRGVGGAGVAQRGRRWSDHGGAGGEGVLVREGWSLRLEGLCGGRGRRALVGPRRRGCRRREERRAGSVRDAAEIGGADGARRGPGGGRGRRALLGPTRWLRGWWRREVRRAGSCPRCGGDGRGRWSTAGGPEGAEGGGRWVGRHGGGAAGGGARCAVLGRVGDAAWLVCGAA